MLAISSNHWLDWTHPFFWITLFKWVGGSAVAWGGLYFRRWKKRRSEESAQSWPLIEARVSSGKVVPIPQTSRFIATLEYIYFLDEYHTGKYTHEFSKESDADEFVRNMREKRVQIRYKQSNPDQSVLEQSVIEQHIQLAPRFG